MDRSKSSSFTYLFCWLFIVISCELYKQSSFLIIFNSVVFFGYGIAGILFRAIGKRYVNTHPQNLFIAFASFSLIIALHWGLLSAYLTYILDIPLARTPMLITTIMMGALGIVNVPLSRRGGVAFIILLLTPTIFASLWYGTAESQLVALFYSLSMFALFKAARINRDRYWDALKSQVFLESKAQALHEISIKDGLTGLYNRLYFEERFAEEWEFAVRGQQVLAIMMIDIDYFKKVNDQWGHQAGDACLKHVAQLLATLARRRGDIVARYGGEEFVVLFPQTTKNYMSTVAEEIVRTVESQICHYNGENIPLTISAGIVVDTPNQNETREAFLQMADVQLYAVKAQGRNGFKIAPKAD